MIQVTPNFRVKTPRTKRKRGGDDTKHLNNLRELPCCVCGAVPPVTVHHLKAGRGSQRKSEDRCGIPLCWFRGDSCHNQIEAVGTKNELTWLKARGVDGPRLADELWAARGSLNDMRRAAAAHSHHE